MTGAENQKRLDKIKWKASEAISDDLSGKMDYCSGCDYQKITSFGEETYCIASQHLRESKCACSKSYYRVMKKLNKSKKD